ncbi:uncharacterized protein BO88DRAFT_423961 [Aspergillus vadensis CBS 113365]|uniref:Protein kinase domain-containing protein n=1 Tax=Aspergillus vadensis (strain CBS 113365 / IMI 142717 / IBT 24658) TaxID=1448311 RepID=A0A319BG96_ASPVC|nr:hypothetical protein BO88DRAFT_423961 [Aspergillus vadensis CBS 113365]PYH71211.1 hypothetical protein BO88DRAFT_423961 [Aspergillus vadensis CBS 113365]
MSAFLTLSLACERGKRYRLVRPLGTPVRNKASNVWLAIDDPRPDAEYIMKIPPGDSNDSPWSSTALAASKHELEMQRLFAKDPIIRPFTDSLWDARDSRPFTTNEIKWIMKGVLLGIYTVHFKGLVYTANLTCFIISKPSTREITPLTYRSPESTDVWSWGIIFLQAQVDLKSPGMYDSVRTGTLREKRDDIRNQLAVDFDLSSLPFYAEDEQCARILPIPQPETAYMWANTMVEKGVSHEDIQILVEVLHPDPNARLTVREILESGYLDG